MVVRKASRNRKTYDLNHKLIAFFAITMYYTLRKNDTGERIR